MFVTAKGITPYTFDKNSAASRSATAPARANWPPALAADSAKPMGVWTIVTQHDDLRH